VIQAGIAGCLIKKLHRHSGRCEKRNNRWSKRDSPDSYRDKKIKNPFWPETYFPWPISIYKGWLENDHEILKNSKLKKVNAISVNEITTARQRVKFYNDSFKPVTESMEGAALHYTCLMENIPFIQLRSISNYIAERDKKNGIWKTQLLIWIRSSSA